MNERQKAAVLLQMHREKCREYSKSINYDWALQYETEKTRRLGDEVQALWFAIEAVAREYPDRHSSTGEVGRLAGDGEGGDEGGEEEK